MPTILRTLDIMTIIQPVFPPCSDPNPTLSTQQAISVTVVLGDKLVSQICQAKSPGCYLRARGPRAPVSWDHCEEVERVTHFKYLGTSIEEEGGMETEIAKRVGAGWMNWKKSSGVLCDKKMPVKLKGKVYRTVVRPAMLYGAETWATTKRQESRIEVNEMRMLRWMCGVTRKDKIRNEHIRGTTKVAQASRKITDRRLKWYGHVMRMEEDHVVKRVMTKAIPGKRKRGRPKTRWKDVCKRDMQTVGLREGDE